MTDTVWIVRERRYPTDETPAVLYVCATRECARQLEKENDFDREIQEWAVIE